MSAGIEETIMNNDGVPHNVIRIHFRFFRFIRLIIFPDSGDISIRNLYRSDSVGVLHRRTILPAQSHQPTTGVHRE